jgi:hypothetical protein
VRLNLKEKYLSAILGPATLIPLKRLPLAAFGNYDYVLQNLRFTASYSNGIESYELYWVFSLIDYYRYSGDREGTASLLPDTVLRLDHAWRIYGTNPKLGFFGWDERLGAGFEHPDIAENQNAYGMLAIRAWREGAELLRALGEDVLASRYEAYAVAKTAELRRDARWHERCGLHAAADAISAGVVSGELLERLGKRHFADRIRRLSYSPFIVQAMSAADRFGGGILKYDPK